MSYIELGDGTVAHINRPGTTREIHREELGERWCFKCRKRRNFIYTVMAEIEPSYYDPNPYVRCEHCGTDDGDCFPGTHREWEC